MILKLALLLATGLAATAVVAEEIPTRFGNLTINAQNVLIYKGRPLNPSIEGNNSLTALGVFQSGASDVALVPSA